MSKITYIDSHSQRLSDNWVAGKKIVADFICELTPDLIYISNVVNHPNAEERVDQHSRQLFDSQLPDDYEQAGQRVEGEEVSHLSAMDDQKRAIKKKKRTSKREVKYGKDKAFTWNRHELAMYMALAVLAILAFFISMSVVATIITSSGLFYMFTEHPALSALVATAPILGGAIFKAADSLFLTEKGKRVYAFFIYISSVIALIGWVVTFSFTFKDGGSSNLLSLLDSTPSEDSLSYQLWIIFQLTVEVLGGAIIALIAQKNYLSKLKKTETENPVFVGALEDESEAATRARSIDNRIGNYLNYRNRIDQAREKFIAESLAVLHDYQERISLAKMNASQVEKNTIRLEVSQSSNLSQLTVVSSK